MASLLDSIFGTKKTLKDAASTGTPAATPVTTPAGIDVAAEAAKVAAAKKKAKQKSAADGAAAAMITGRKKTAAGRIGESLMDQ